MTLRAKKRLLWTLSGALALGLVATAGGMALAPLKVPTPGAPPRPGLDRETPPEPGEPVPLSAYAAAYERNLQRPLYDPKPPVVVKRPPPPPKPPPVTLKGTMVEPGFVFAVFRTQDGRQRTVRVGEEVEGAELVGVTPGAAVLRFEGREHTLQAPKVGGDG
jgi:hypothetical protein